LAHHNPFDLSGAAAADRTKPAEVTIQLTNQAQRTIGEPI
jgi:hypothetical protein